MAINLDTQRTSLGTLQQTALAWWESQRPTGWGLRDHLDNPAVNTTTQQEAALAKAVAGAVEVGAI